MGNHPLGDDPHWPLLSCLPYHGPLAQGQTSHGLAQEKGVGAAETEPAPPTADTVSGVLPPFCLLDSRNLPFAPSVSKPGKIESWETLCHPEPVRGSVAPLLVVAWFTLRDIYWISETIPNCATSRISDPYLWDLGSDRLWAQMLICQWDSFSHPSTLIDQSCPFCSYYFAESHSWQCTCYCFTFAHCNGTDKDILP